MEGDDLALRLPELRLPETPDEHTVADVALAAHALAYVVIANRRFTDLFEWGQRSVPLSIAAEIQHRLLPGAYTCEAGQFTLAGWLEPAGDNAGDTFDFSLEREMLHFSLTDAMGHDTDAALLATLLVGALRNARRAGVELAEQARRASAVLTARSEHIGFVTGQLVRVDLRRETAAVVNAGHPLPRRVRAGRVERVGLLAEPPFGAVTDHAYRVQRLPLEPGDRVMFLTDGMLERNAASLDVDALLLACAGAHPREAVQVLMAGVLDAAGGELRDDATALCFDWHGGHGERATYAGANRRDLRRVDQGLREPRGRKQVRRWESRSWPAARAAQRRGASSVMRRWRCCRCAGDAVRSADDFVVNTARDVATSRGSLRFAHPVLAPYTMP